MAITGTKPISRNENKTETKSEGKAEKAKTYDVLTDDNYRCAYVNDRGEVTIIDEETAKTLFENPKFYSTVYDSGRMTHVDPKLLRWADKNGVATELVVGEKYERKDF